MLTRLHQITFAMAMLWLVSAVASVDAALPEGVTATSLGEKVQRYDFHSAALNKPMAFVVVQPKGYSTQGSSRPVLTFVGKQLARGEN